MPPTVTDLARWHVGESCQNGRTDQDAVWGQDRPKKLLLDEGGRLSDGNRRHDDAAMVDGQVVVSGAWTRSVDDVVAGPAQTTENGAVSVVPRLGEIRRSRHSSTTSSYLRRSDRTFSILDIQGLQMN